MNLPKEEMRPTFHLIKTCLTFFFLSVYLFPSNLKAQFSYVKPSNVQKIFSSDYGNSLSSPAAIVPTADKKILQFVNSGGQVVISRHYEMGGLDLSFGNNGTILSTFGGVGASVSEAITLPNGQFLISGEIMTNSSPLQGKMLLAKFNSNGSLESSFGLQGIAKIPLASSTRNYAWSFGILSDSTYLLGGSFNTGTSRDFLIVKVKKNGVIDSTFGTNGYLTSDYSLGDDIYNILPGDNGRAYIAANVKTGNSRYDFTVIKTTLTGLDNTFGSNGVLTFSMGNNDAIPYRLIFNTNGNILIGGQVINNNGDFDMGFAQISPNGSFDNTFGTGGKKILPISSLNNGVRSMQLLSNGNILIGGFAQTTSGSMYSVVVQTNSSGQLLNSFGNGGVMALPNIITTIYNTNQGRTPFCGTMVLQSPWDSTSIYCNTANLESSNHALAAYVLNKEKTINLNDNCLAYYPFNGDYLDYSGNNLHIQTIFGTRFTSDRFNSKLSAVSFAGGSDRLLVPNSSILGLVRNGLSISLWINQKAANCATCEDRIPNYGYSLISKSYAGYFSGGFDLFARGINQGLNITGRKMRLIAGYGTVTGIDTEDNYDYELNEWNHLVVTFDLNIVSYYVNGILTTTVASPLAAITENVLPLSIGGPSDDTFNNTGFNYKGLMDEVRIYSRVLNPEEIIHLKDQYSNENGCNLTDTIFRTIPMPDESVGFYTISYPSNKLVYFDTTGNITEIGPLSAPLRDKIGSLDFSVDGKLYYMSLNDSLYSINQNTGKSTFISRVLENNTDGGDICSITFNPKGELFVMDEKWSMQQGKLRLIKDMYSGLSTSLGINTSAIANITAIESDDLGNIWAMDECCINSTFKLNTANGIAGNYLPNNSNQSFVSELDFTKNTLYGISIYDASGSTNQTTLFKVNLTTGLTTNIVTLSGIYLGLAGRYNKYIGDTNTITKRKKVELWSTVTITRFVGISKLNESGIGASLSVFPNPSSGFLHIVDPKNEVQFFTLIDAIGNEQESGSFNSVLTFGLKPRGIYYLRLFNHNKEMIFNQKIILE